MERTQDYGQELILDLHDCDSSRFTRDDIQRYCEELCELIEMERCDLHFWDDVGVPEAEQQTHPKTKGTSAVQFILTSTIVIHTPRSHEGGLREHLLLQGVRCRGRQQVYGKLV